MENIKNETPIKSKTEDLLNFQYFAESISNIIEGYQNNPESLTIGIYGKWGYGKTSLLNLIQEKLEEKKDKYILFHYNPWIYSSQEEMLFSFFTTLANKLETTEDSNLKKAGKFIKKYGKYLKAIKISASLKLPFIAESKITVDPYEILKALGEDLEEPKKSIEDVKNEINTTLEQSKKKIILFIDDIDRLDKEEIFTLLKLVKANADFKNTLFILSLDPEQVTQAIYTRYGTDEEAGRAFLEKIINIPLEVPLVEKVDLNLFIKDKLEKILATGKARAEEIEELMDSLNGSYFNSPRDILRIFNSFTVSYYAIGGETHVHDLFWIEYLKVLYYPVYKKIKNYSINNSHSNSSIIHLNEKVLELREEKTFPIIKKIFPQQTNFFISEYDFNKNLRINHINHFEKYFSYHTKGKISFLKFENFKNLVKKNKDEEAKNLLSELIIDSSIQNIFNEINYNLIPKSYGGNLEKYIFFIIKNLDIFEPEKEKFNYFSKSMDIIRTIV